MKTIIDIRDGIVYIGDDDGTLLEVRREDCYFEPAVGNVVKVFSNKSKTIVTKLSSLNSDGFAQKTKFFRQETVSDNADHPGKEAEQNNPFMQQKTKTENKQPYSDPASEAKSATAAPPQANSAHLRLVNKTIYCLLAFFLGGLGAHKFYAGKTGLGIAYLLFCWTGVPSLIALIEFFIAIFKPSDKDGNILV